MEDGCLKILAGLECQTQKPGLTLEVMRAPEGLWQKTVERIVIQESKSASTQDNVKGGS